MDGGIFTLIVSLPSILVVFCPDGYEDPPPPPPPSPPPPRSPPPPCSPPPPHSPPGSPQKNNLTKKN